MNGTMTREYGTIKWFDLMKGYGFIRRDGDRDLFVHERALAGCTVHDLREDTAVSYVLGVDRNGKPCARDVRLDADR